MKFSLKFLLIAAAIGFVVSSIISLIVTDLSWFCKYGLISLIPQCTNPYAYVLILTLGAIFTYLVLLGFFRLKEMLKSKG
jgi:hypothetical protein